MAAATESSPTQAAWVGLGSNQGDRRALLAQALERIGQLPAVELVRSSPVYETEPWGDTDQPAFLNAVAELAVSGTAEQLLESLQAIEADLGRVRGERRWGPRPIDLDILVFGDQAIDTPDLVVPHPRLPERAFVLVPLADIAPGLRVPGRGVVADLLAAIDTTTVSPAGVL
ncbi:2-amino-4-hydroxy-6-hydroxymethyldihydropteridine diphosphokinase [Marinihelvus fidelis]|uniref:2-amino-4-hydroxy-6- hydroxymethyldihydropteridine diphosphokinase n=1 Tax=Marinihelvus fidelis TaxID=2613842 RepID=UPI001CD5916C|nr:2-amino-4-hydroxy-6-hydroxymethyldihydropteridine diphosphokinase [Marinihelvus fidelis]